MRHESGDDTKSVSLACEFTTLCWLTQEKEKWLIPTQITKGGKDNPTDEQSFKRKCQWKNGRDEPNINIQQAHWQSGDVGLRPQTHGWCKGEEKKGGTWATRSMWTPDSTRFSEDAHPFVQNGALRERKTACYWLGPNALLIVLLVSSVRPQREFGESRRVSWSKQEVDDNRERIVRQHKNFKEY